MYQLHQEIPDKVQLPNNTIISTLVWNWSCPIFLSDYKWPDNSPITQTSDQKTLKYNQPSPCINLSVSPNFPGILVTQGRKKQLYFGILLSRIEPPPPLCKMSKPKLKKFLKRFGFGPPLSLENVTT